MAITSKMWMNPPSVELVTSPSAHRTTRIIAIVINIKFDLSYGFMNCVRGISTEQTIGHVRHRRHGVKPYSIKSHETLTTCERLFRHRSSELQGNKGLEKPDPWTHLQRFLPKIAGRLLKRAADHFLNRIPDNDW